LFLQLLSGEGPAQCGQSNVLPCLTSRVGRYANLFTYKWLYGSRLHAYLFLTHILVCGSSV